MSARVALSEDFCLGAGRVVLVSGREATFRSVTCPVCNRPNLHAEDIREDEGRHAAKVPRHRAKVTEVKDIGAAHFGSDAYPAGPCRCSTCRGARK